MKKSWISAFVAIVTVAANGCAGGADGATMEVPVGITLSPLGENVIASSSVNVPLAASAGTGVLATGDVVDGTRLASAPTQVCAVADASSSTMATARSLGSCVRGALVADDVGQYFVFSPEHDVDYAMRLVGDGDATFDLGVSTVGPGGARRCAVFTAGITSTRFSSNEGVGDLCVVVRSDSGSAQAFRLGLTH